jgi:glycine/D-amino acid oxidase-like deaminating enzyme
MRLWSGTPYWYLRNGLRDSPTVQPRDCDVAIVGAGVTGALLADSLTAAGLSVTVLDRRSPSEGSTAACTGIVTYELDLGLVELGAKLDEKRAARSYCAAAAGVRRLATIVESLPEDCAFAWKPTLYIGTRRRDAKALQREVDARERAGIHTEYLKGSDLEATFGLDAHGALHTELTALVDPVRLTRALLDRAGRSRMVLCADTTVLSWSAGEHGVTVETTRGCFRAGRIIFATGYETPPAFRDDLVSLHSSYAIATRPLPGPLPKAAECILWNTERPYFYSRPAEGNRIVIGGEDLPFRSPDVRDGLITRRTERLERRLASLFPGLEAETEFAWAGTFGETRDSLPYIGAHDDAPGALFALGYGGNGIVFSAIAADILRDIVLGVENECVDLFAFDRSEQPRMLATRG